ncbi:MAG: GntR family transcriptional regulator [Clostridium sp.]|nr:GntR family transcriptional regulator [Acetatifactor muris]MCM1527083.1 GntR family transcriptional regulator [Bacteroides sp.]MCM1562059.1 GntR family transcriptional regulator [Clostridium sp.]
MAWSMDSDRPIYIQLVERIQMQIVSGYYPCGAKLPSVRELAAVAAVNPNTMQKAFAELERSGLIVTQRTNGRTVTEDRELVESIRQNMAKMHIETFVGKMKELGYSGEQMEALLRQTLRL